MFDSVQPEDLIKTIIDTITVFDFIPAVFDHPDTKLPDALEIIKVLLEWFKLAEIIPQIDVDLDGAVAAFKEYLASTSASQYMLPYDIRWFIRATEQVVTNDVLIHALSECFPRHVSKDKIVRPPVNWTNISPSITDDGCRFHLIGYA